jgi:hypothetical protein
MPGISLEKRLAGFDEVETGFTEDMAIAEARRCLKCNLRLCMRSVMLPPVETAAPITSGEAEAGVALPRRVAVATAGD